MLLISLKKFYSEYHFVCSCSGKNDSHYDPPITLNVPAVSGRFLFNSPDFIGDSLYTYPYIYRLKCVFEYLASNQVVGSSNLSGRAIKSSS